MHPLIRPLTEMTPLRDPILIGGFAGTANATAAATIAYLIDQWSAEPLAELDPDELFVLTGLRPVVVTDGRQRTLQWPSNRFYVARPAGIDRDVVLFLGMEPHLRWNAFCDAVASVMQEVGCRGGVLLSAYPTATPHTRPIPLHLFAQDGYFGQSFGLQPVAPSYTGPVDIAGALAVKLERAFAVVSLVALVPFYLGGGQNLRGMVALIEALDRSLGTRTPLAGLQRQAAMMDRQADHMTGHSEELRSLVQSLEQQTDSGHVVERMEAGGAATAGLPSSEELIAEVERFLASHQAGDREDGAIEA